MSWSLLSTLQHLPCHNTYAQHQFLDSTWLAKLADQHTPVTGSGTSFRQATGGEGGKEGPCSAHSQYGAPQRCCLGPQLFSLYIEDCTSDEDNNIIVYTDDTVVLSLIKGRDQSLYRDLAHNMTVYGEDNLILGPLPEQIQRRKEEPRKTMRREEGATTHLTLSELKYHVPHCSDCYSWWNFSY